MLGSCKLAHHSRSISFCIFKSRYQAPVIFWHFWIFDFLIHWVQVITCVYANLRKMPSMWGEMGPKNADFWCFADLTDGRSPICAYFKFLISLFSNNIRHFNFAYLRQFSKSAETTLLITFVPPGDSIPKGIRILRIEPSQPAWFLQRMALN